MSRIRRKLWSREDSIFGEAAERVNSEVSKAQADALVFGTGLLELTAEGDIRRVTLKELIEKETKFKEIANDIKVKIKRNLNK